MEHWQFLTDEIQVARLAHLADILNTVYSEYFKLVVART